MTPFALTFSPKQTVAEVEALLAEHAIGGGPVLDARGNLLGVMALADIQRVPSDKRPQRLVEEAMNRDVLVAHPDDTLDVALEQLTSHRVGWMPVVEVEAASGGRHVIGRLSTLDITRAYRETLAKGARRMRGLVEGTVMVEAEIEAGMRLAGRPLKEAKLPLESLVVSIRRQNELLFPRGSTIIEPGDVVTFLVSPSGEERLHEYLAQRLVPLEPPLPQQAAQKR
jgi:CBS domain-containing protein